MGSERKGGCNVIVSVSCMKIVDDGVMIVILALYCMYIFHITGFCFSFYIACTSKINILML